MFAAALRQLVRDVPIAVNPWTTQTVRNICKRTVPNYKWGLKHFNGHHVLPRQMLAVQRGCKIKPGENVDMGVGGQLSAPIEGTVQLNHMYWLRRKTNKCSGRPYKHKRTYVNVDPMRRFEARYHLQHVYLPGERRAVVPNKFDAYLP